MKLLRINIHGFKSFADKTVIDIKDGITGIVGPNGSGKSNIVDAVKWVLGEQSLKDIRAGNTSSDVIFMGSKSRGALTRAWVSLVFDNSDHYLNSDLQEIEIKRVVYRSGENEYYINNELVRLKDITNLFIDSGSSVNSLSIISQGKIGQIINGKPEEKRSIIEEAAGVLKYKKRKEETLRKLDKTNDNLEKVNLVIDELMVNLEPLKSQADNASRYLTLKKDLEDKEIGLLAYDIDEINKSYLEHKNEKDRLDKEVMSVSNVNVLDNNKIDGLKLSLLKLEDEINSKSEQLYKITSELSSLASEKQIMLERKKLSADDTKLEANILSLNESKLKIKSEISSLEEELKRLNETLESKKNSASKLMDEYKKCNIDKEVTNEELAKLVKNLAESKNKIEILKDNINSDSKLPYAVKSVINNHKLSGIMGVIGKLIETSSEYAQCIDISLGALANVVVTSDEKSARDAITYLKQSGTGRVTFFPLNVIRPKRIDDSVLSKISGDSAFIGVASSLVKFDPIYRNIILNVLGNVIVTDNLVNANRLGKLINYSYKIVTLEGDVANAGGSITGGATNTKTGLINLKFELDKELKLYDEKVNSIKLKEERVNDLDNELKILETRVFNSNNEFNGIRDTVLRKEKELEELKQSFDTVDNEIKGNSGLLNNTIDKEIEELLSKYYDLNSKKDLLLADVNLFKANKNDLQASLSELELSNRKQNSEYNALVKELNDINVLISKEEVKLDNLLLRLNEEYGITFEKAKATYLETLEDAEEVRGKVNYLKREIKTLGDVNVGAINEYERVNSRYTFLSTQRDDLTSSINDLLKVINELDDEMKERLTSTFDELNKAFKMTFVKLFRGGEAELVLTDPTDILNTGLEIKAVPPGKGIKNTKLLSGGEATLTAIALLFAVLSIRTVPFCILDEVEAALDEANVDMFGKYLKEIESSTQFIIITHKKRTMEYTNNLYGITMQESGVSKLVSVKLEA